MLRALLLCGVGGQGLIAAGRVLGWALLEEGYYVRVAEIHGLSQRGGSVIVHIKFSDSEDIAPTIPLGGANAVIALELIESVRALRYLRRDGVLLVNDLLLPPPAFPKPPSRESVVGYLKENGVKYYLLRASEVAKDLGAPYVANTVMIGAAYEAGLVPVAESVMERAIRTALPRAHELNIKAFKAGRKLWRCSALD